MPSPQTAESAPPTDGCHLETYGPEISTGQLLHRIAVDI